MTTTKKCRICGETKPLDAFHKRSANGDIRRGDCKECQHARQHGNRNVEARRTYMAEYRARNIERLTAAGKRRAAEKRAERERLRALEPPREKPKCSVLDCGRDRECGGMCNKHYQRTRIHGTADLPTPCPPTADLPGEEWRPTICFPGYYVSNLGRIWGRRGHLLRTGVVTGGYLTVAVHDGKRRRTKLIQGLVAEAFIGPRPEGYEVNHKDGVKTNNTPPNLEYVTPSANVRHSLDVLGVQRAKGSENGQSKLTEAQVAEMRTRFAAGGISVAALAREIGIHPATAAKIVQGKSWKHVTGEPIELVA